ncbi:type IV secretory system conjugative DNA transfer family protein [Amorphus sp. 3PC139-8]|uniref:type IV secretory system conjugative DNA transfer family protein n=1 Tax=Amorphus sp. 3PC139-8 TaxID=2735676 RepID=UPI00345DB011
MERVARAIAITGCLSLVGCVALGEAPPAAVPAPVPQIGGHDDLQLGPPPKTLADVKIEAVDPRKEMDGLGGIRGQALREAALSYGSQLGYAYRAWQIEKRLEVQSRELDAVFDFGRVAMSAPRDTGYVLPPVVGRSFAAFEGDTDGTRVTAADEYLQIVAPGRLSPVVPTWRDYLLFAAEEPEELASSLKPQSRDEVAVFKREIEAGYAAGMAQADAALEEKLARLRRDFEGMAEYRRLVAQGMMNRIVVADADFGVTGGGDTMRIGERVVQIVGEAQFEADPRVWRAVTPGPEDAAIVERGSIGRSGASE